MTSPNFLREWYLFSLYFWHTQIKIESLITTKPLCQTQNKSKMRKRSAAGRSTVTAVTVDNDVNSAPARHQAGANGYNKEAMIILRNSFPLISVDAIRRTYESSRNSFTAAFRTLSSIQDSIHEQNDERKRRKRILELAPFLKDVKRIDLKSERKAQAHRPNNPTLTAELDAIPEMNTKENRPIQAESGRDDESHEIKKAPPESSCVCACCFDDECRFETMCHCTEGHLVCSDCLRHYVEEQIDGKGVGHLQCMGMESGECTATYTSNQLDKAFSPKSRQKVDEKMFRFHFNQVEMDDSW